MTAEGRRAALDIMMASASKHPGVGHTLLLDTAYSLYANEPHGWGQTIVDAMEDGTPWPENFLITYALSLSNRTLLMDYEREHSLVFILTKPSRNDSRIRSEPRVDKHGRLHLESSNTLQHNCTAKQNLQKSGHTNETASKACSQNEETSLSRHASSTAYQSIQPTMDSLHGLNIMTQNRSQKLVQSTTSTSYHYEEEFESACAQCQPMQSNVSQRHLQLF